MPIKETLTAKPVTLADVLSNTKRYVVPPFQRDYAWDEDEWRELWADLVQLSRAPEDAANHYLGALVLQQTGLDSRIIDGQQRLVTLSLLALAVIRKIKKLAEDLSGNSSGNVLTELPVFATIKGPMSCSVPGIGPGLPIGDKVVVTCAGDNWSSSPGSAHAQGTLTINLN